MGLLNDKKISVVVPVYNTEEYLEECFESIFNQSYKNMEVIAINDGSTDGSFYRLKQIQKKYPDLIVKNQINHGLGATRNVGISATSGEYLYFMDSDDIIETDMFEKAVMLLEDNNCDFVGFQADIFGDIEGKNINQYMYVDKYLENKKIYEGIEVQEKYFLKLPLYNIPFCIYKRSFFENNNLYFMEGVIHEDEEFYWHMMAYNPKLIVSKEVMYHRRYRRASIMTNVNHEFRFKSRLQVFARISDEAPNELSDIYLYHAISCLNLSLREAILKDYLPDKDDLSFIESFLNRKMKVLPVVSVLHKLLFFSYMNKLEKNGYQFDRKDSLIRAIKEDVFFDEMLSELYVNSSKIAIYGTGDFAQIVLDSLEMALGYFSADIVYLDTFVKTGERQFREKSVFNYQDVNLEKFNMILILSELYDAEIRENISSVCNLEKTVSLIQYIS